LFTAIQQIITILLSNFNLVHKTKSDFWLVLLLILII
jgi:hypothetical protein